MTDITLFSPHSLRDVTFRNRIWVSPMCQYSVDLEDGVPTDWHLVHLGAFARGGAGLVMTEAAAVSPEGRISAEDVGIYSDRQRDAWVRIVDFIVEQGSVPAIQLAHAGRKASVYREWGPNDGTRPVGEGGWQSVAPSAIAFDGYAVPVELDAEGIDRVVADFVSAARRSVDAGFRVLELHAAHGYLLHQFLSPLSNHRTDEYGGSLENRARLLLDIVRTMRAEVGDDIPIFVRFSATDYHDDGWDVEQTSIVTAWAREAGADLFDISSGGLVTGVTIPVAPGYQVHFATEIKTAAGAEVNAVGLITTAVQANDIVASGQADAVMMAREIMRDPHFPLRAAHELGIEIDYWPKQYHRAHWR